MTKEREWHKCSYTGIWFAEYREGETVPSDAKIFRYTNTFFKPDPNNVMGRLKEQDTVNEAVLCFSQNDFDALIDFWNKRYPDIYHYTKLP